MSTISHTNTEEKSPNSFTIQELLDDSEIMSHLFLECVPHDKLKQISEKAGDWKKNKYSVKTQLLIEGEPIDTRPFFQLFFNQYENLVNKEARELIKELTVNDKLQELIDKTQELNEMIQSCIGDINFEVKNVFKNEQSNI